MATALLDLALWTSVLANTIIPAQFSINKNRASQSVLATLLLMLTILYVFGMSGFEPRELP
jgi:hypothetical protein